MANQYSVFNDLLTTSKTPLFSLDSTGGLSVLRDSTLLVGSGSVTNTTGVHVVATGSTTSSESKLDTLRRGYHGGTAGLVVNMSAALSGAPSGNQVATWGYLSDTSGAGFGQDSTSPYVILRSGSSDTKVVQASWNIDKLDGSGTSGLTLDTTHINYYQVAILWGGMVEYTVILPDGTTKLPTPVVVHRIAAGAVPPVDNPVCPVRAIVGNGSTAANLSISVGTREVALLGPQPGTSRIGSHFFSTPLGLSIFTNVLNLSRKGTGNSPNIEVRLAEVEISAATQPALFRVVRSTPNSPTNLNPNGVLAGESCLQVDTTDAPTAIQVIFQFVAPANAYSRHVLPPDLFFNQTQNYTLQVGSTSGTAGAATLNVKWEEMW